MEAELFSLHNHGQNEPLAARMRPRNLDEYIGQEHIIGKGRLLRRAIQADRLSSLILYGPPGTGKTTLARVIAHHTKSHFISINAVLAGVQQIREAVHSAEERKKLYGTRTILFVDEVHRWNKSQQDALLPWVENGTIILIGATTENPFFKVNNALVSRSRVFQLHPLSEDDMYAVVNTALHDTERGYGKKQITIDPNALEHLVHTAAGDARSVLNALELAVETAEASADGTIHITIDIAEESIQQKVVLYDADGDYHYDVISAFIKSIRGSDANAALYWLAKMLAAGEDPSFIFRRLMISACEDVGLAQPEAISIVTACAEAFDRIGLPEGRFHLTHATLYLATAKKSNSALAFFDALKAVESDSNGEVPNHLKDGSRDAAGLGHGTGYKYPHNYHSHWVAQQYLPDGMEERMFYTPSCEGYEGTIRERIIARQEQQVREAQLNTDSIAQNNDTSDFFLSQTHNIPQSARILLYAPPSITSVESISQHCQNGCTVALCTNNALHNALIRYTESLEFFSKPIIYRHNETPIVFDDIDFDYILAEEPARTTTELTHFFAQCRTAMTTETRLNFRLTLPEDRVQLSDILSMRYGKAKDSAIIMLMEAEKAFLNEHTDAQWNTKTVLDLAEKEGIHLHATTEKVSLTRRYSIAQLAHWFSEGSVYGAFLSKKGFDLNALKKSVSVIAEQDIALSVLKTHFTAIDLNEALKQK